MIKIKRNKYFLLIAASMLAGILLHSGLVFPQFLSEDPGVKKKKTKTQRSEAASRKRELANYIVRNIKAARVPDVQGAIRVTWQTAPGNDDDFIVGRSRFIPFTAEKALRADSIKVVPAGADPVIIDSGLPPGEYFYVILSRDNVRDKNIQLYPDVNYTSMPVVIEQNVPSGGGGVAPELITLIHGMVINKTQVLLTWRGSELPGIIYTVYRSSESLNSPAKMRSGLRVTTITDGSESFVDKSIKKTGNYYYAVTTRDLSGNEDLQLVPDQSYSTTGLFISLGESVVGGLNAQLSGSRSVKLSWAGDTQLRGNYIIYRSDRAIANSEVLALSEKIGSVETNIFRYVDLNPGIGRHFYAVLTQSSQGKIDANFIEGTNYTIYPVVVGKSVGISSISAISRDGKVIVSWQAGASVSGPFQIVRSAKRIRKKSDIAKGEMLGKTDVSKKKYVDEEPPSGSLYYAIVPENYSSKSTFKIKPGRNALRNPVFAGKKRRRRVEPIEEDFDVSTVDRIVQKYFFNERYDTTMRKLSRIENRAESSRERAKARLFIGRSLIEKGLYSKALDYLLLPDVEKYYPREYEFWKEYAISHIK